MSNWKSYWATNPKLFMRVMQNSTQYFSEMLYKYQLVSQSHTVLDYGCGPGNLAKGLKGKIGRYYGVDISESYIQEAKRKMGDSPEFHFIHLSTDQPFNEINIYTKNEQLFDSIIIFSVVQYFNNSEDIVDLLQNCKSILKPNGKIILADVIENEQGAWKDLWSICLHSLSKGYFTSFLIFVARLKLSNYNEVKKNCKLLLVSQAEVERISKRINMRCSILPKITLQKSRNSFCITL